MPLPKEEMPVPPGLPRLSTAMVNTVLRFSVHPSKTMYFWCVAREQHIWYFSFVCNLVSRDDLLPTALHCLNTFELLEEHPEGE